MNTAVYTSVIMDKDETWKPAGIVAAMRLRDGKWVKKGGYTFHHGAPPEYSHKEAVRMFSFLYKLDNSYAMAPAHDGKHDFIFV